MSPCRSISSLFDHKKCHTLSHVAKGLVINYGDGGGGGGYIMGISRVRNFVCPLFKTG